MKNKLFLVYLVIHLFASCKAHALLHGDDNCKREFDSLSNSMVYVNADLMPSFENNETLPVYFAKRLKVTSEDDFQSKINLVFIVDTTKYVVGARIKNKGLKNLSKLEYKALKIAEQMPKWNTGKCNNKIVAVKISVPIYF